MTIPEARSVLLRSACHFIQKEGWSIDQWLTDDSVMEYANRYGLQYDLEHFAELANSGFSKRD